MSWLDKFSARATKTIKRLYYYSVTVLLFLLIFYTEYTTFKQGYILFITYKITFKIKDIFVL